MKVSALKVKEVVDYVKGKSAVVVLSGGQDSVTCLGLALRNFETVHAIGFSYGQKHEVEIHCAAQICAEHDVPFAVFEIPALQSIGNSALIRGTEQTDVSAQHAQNSKLPASFVPNRNALFLTTAHAYAQKVGADCLITGVCETDYSGYPDCRDIFIRSLEETLNLGYETNIKIYTPLMWLNKAETFALAKAVDFLMVVLEDSHTCYNGDHNTNFVWGYGCGECPACKLRAAGFEAFVAANPFNF
ncbi:MAG: 7-cyano-7-deazaguanine synthase QueC [Leifsonia xyli]|nr:MAG: 7-cyano-7-deazaguanine synthase QueC [Leifsonia xyli]